MKKTLFLTSSAAILMFLSACNYNNYDRETSPYRGQVAFEHPDENAPRPQRMKTVTVKRDLTTTDGGTVRTRTVTEDVVVPDYGEDNTEDVKKAQRAVSADRNYYEVDINENKTIRRK